MNRKIIDDALDAHNRALGYLAGSRNYFREAAESAHNLIKKLEESNDAQERAIKEIIAANNAVLQMLRDDAGTKKPE